MFYRHKSHGRHCGNPENLDEFEGFNAERGARQARPDDFLRARHHRAGGHGRERGEGDPGMGLRRLFAHGDLRLAVLALTAEKPRHGYEIIKAIEDRVNGAYSPSPGVIYPTLTMLEELGHLRAEAEASGSRKMFAVTPEGEAYLAANRKSLDALYARMDEAREANASVAAPQIVRAMENLKLALRLRLSRGPLDAAQIDAVAKALDRAVAEIEKV